MTWRGAPCSERAEASKWSTPRVTAIDCLRRSASSAWKALSRRSLTRLINLDRRRLGSKSKTKKLQQLRGPKMGRFKYILSLGGLWHDLEPRVREVIIGLLVMIAISARYI